MNEADGDDALVRTVDELADRLTTGTAVSAVADLADEPRYEPLWQEIAGHGIRAVLAAPVRLDGQVVGNLNALDPEPHVWSGAQRRAAEACAAIVGQLLGLAAHGVGASVERNGRGPVR